MALDPGSCPAQCCFEQKAWFLLEAPPPAAAGHIHVPGHARARYKGVFAMRLPVLDRRRAGVLLHLGSLDAALGRGGRAFIDWLADAGFSVWQILPAGPTGADGSPYWVRSDFAGNPAFLDRAELPKVEPAEEAAFRD